MAPIVTPEQPGSLSPEACNSESINSDDLSYTPGVQLKPFVGCGFCVYAMPPGRGPIPTVPRATMSVRTPRGIRQLCDMHAALFLPDDSQNLGAPSFSAAVPR